MEENTVSINEISVLKQAVEIASRRGAFNADEMSVIGTAYDKIARWLNSVKEEPDQADSEGETDA